MAIYDMRCKDCGEQFSLFCSWSELKASKCPKCGSSNVRQVYSAVTVLKGAGAGSPGTSSSASRKFG
ncbi:MAG TPA: zinc ribbon domain-containing protein [Firmicutes bacterium]|nr:zinc ribbon domain-containing protein [Bacillota bacterium]